MLTRDNMDKYEQAFDEKYRITRAEGHNFFFVFGIALRLRATDVVSSQASFLARGIFTWQVTLGKCFMHNW
jgi:hypothetical protein